MGLHYTRDRYLLHQIVGVALLDDDLCNKLLRQSTRGEVLDKWALSPQVRAFLESLADQPCLEALAACLHADLLGGEKLQ